MTQRKVTPLFDFETGRVQALADGVFAIAMTLLVLELKVPQAAQEGGLSLGQGLLVLWPKFMCYAISFIVLGVYWVAHHLQFVSIRKADRGLLWVNILFFMAVSLVPFSTALIGDHVREQLAVVLYGANLLIIGLALYVQWLYATRGHRLVDPEIDARLVRAVEQIIAVGSGVYVVALGCSFFSTAVSIGLYAAVNLLYIVPGAAHFHLFKHRKHAHHTVAN